MNWDAIGAIGEILGAIGVIVTLGYLAVQIRQNTRSSRVSAFLLYQTAYFHAQRSEIEPHLWRSLESTLGELFGRPGLDSWWDANQNRLSPEFVHYVEAKRADR